MGRGVVRYAHLLQRMGLSDWLSHLHTEGHFGLHFGDRLVQRYYWIVLLFYSMDLFGWYLVKITGPVLDCLARSGH